MFVNRDRLFPRGVRRHRAGTLVHTAFRDLAPSDDGTNEDEVFAAFRSRLGLGIEADKERFLSGILSPAERDEIAGLHGHVRDYLLDVADGAAGPEAILRGAHAWASSRRASSSTVPVASCAAPCEPYISKGGAILSINSRSTIQSFTSMASYPLAHLFMRGTLQGVPFYKPDGEAAMAMDRRFYHTAVLTLSFANSIAAFGALPLGVMTPCGLDMDRW